MELIIEILTLVFWMVLVMVGKAGELVYKAIFVRSEDETEK